MIIQAFTGFLAATIITAIPTGASTLSTRSQLGDQSSIPSEIVIVNANSILGAKQPDPEITPLRIRLYITAYSSSPDETDNTPFITASGKRVRHGVVASNFLPLGAKIKIPDIFGETVFIVEDRMHSRFNDRIDVWMPTKKDALAFGKKLAEVEILLD